MDEIQKLKDGRRVSRNEYAQAKANYEKAYAEADADTRAKLNGLMQSSLNFSSANPMNNRSTREYLTRLYINGAEIANGGQPAGASPIASTPNLFNGYSHIENENNANSVTARYLNANKGVGDASNQAAPAAPAGTSGVQGFYRYNWAKGLDAGWGLETDTLEKRSESLINQLGANIEAALNSGKQISGASRANLEQALSRIQAGGWRNSFEELLRIGQLAGADPTGFKAYFGDLWPGMDKITKNKKSLTDSGIELVDDGGDYGADLNSLIQQNGYHVGKRNGQLVLLSSDYSGVVTGKAQSKINTDYRDRTNYGRGFSIDDGGNFVFGDMNQYYDNQSSPFYNSLKAYVDSEGNDKRYGVSPVNFGLIDESKNSEVVNHFANALQGKKIADLSGYFNGAEVVATSKNNNFDSLVDRYNHLRLDDPNLTFYFKDANGDFVSGNLAQAIKNAGQINLKYDKSRGGYDSFTDYTSSMAGLAPDSDFYSQDLNGRRNDTNAWSTIANYLFTPGFGIPARLAGKRKMTNGWDGTVVDGRRDVSGNDNSAIDSAKFLLFLSQNPNKEKAVYNRMFQGKNRANTIAFIWETFSLNQQAFYSDPNINKYLAAIRELGKTGPVASTASAADDDEVLQHRKEGGVIKAETGLVLDRYGNPATDNGPDSATRNARRKLNAKTARENAIADRAEKNGRSTVQQATIEDNDWSTADTLRATALATDIGGLIAAMTSPATAGLGSVVAVGSGFLSMAQDAIADFTDDKVSTGQAWKNIGVNTLFAGAAAVGGKAPKIIKSAINLVPRAMMALGSAGVVLDPEVHKTVAKVADGKDLNVNDWRNIYYVLRMVTGIGTTHVISRNSKKGVELYKGKVQENLKKMSVKSELDPNKKYIISQDKDVVALTLDDYKKVQTALNKKTDAGVAEAVDILKAADPGLDDTRAGKFITDITGEKSWSLKIKFWDKTEPETVKGITDLAPYLVPAYLEVVAGPEAMAEARIKAIQSIRNQARHSHRFDALNRLEGASLIENFNPALGAALNEAQALGKTYKTVDDLVAAEKGNLNAYSASAAEKAAKPLTDAEFEALNNQFNAEKQNIRANARAAYEADARVKNVEAQEKGLDAVKARRDRAATDANLADQKVADAQAEVDRLQAEVDRAKKPNAKLGIRLKKAKLDLQARLKEQAETGARNKKLTIDADILQLNDKINRLDGYIANNQAKRAPLTDRRDKARENRDNLASLAKNARQQAEGLDKAVANHEQSAGSAREAKAEFRKQALADRLAKMREKQGELFGKSLGKSSKAVTVKVEGADVKIPKGTNTTSYLNIRNEVEAKQVAMEKLKDAKELSKTEWGKLFPQNLRLKMRGAAINPTTGEIAIWKQGGQLEDYTDHRTAEEKARGVGTPLQIKALRNDLARCGYSQKEIDKMMTEMSGDLIRRIISRNKSHK